MRLLGSASIGKRYNLNPPETGIQVFGSAAIVKRLDNNTLEAIDGITITISGCINRARTQSNSFSPEVCDGFLSGFPCNWEDYAAKSSRDKCATNTTERSLSVSFDDLPVTRVRDILMSTISVSESCAFTSIIFRDILKQCGEGSLNRSASSVDTDEKLSRNSTNTELDRKQEHGVSLSNPIQKITKEAHKIRSILVDSHEEASKSSSETEVKQEDQKIPSFSVDLHGEVSENSKKDYMQKDGGFTLTCIQPKLFPAAANLAGTSPKSPVKLIDPFSTHADYKPSSRRIPAEKRNTTKMSGNKRIVTRSLGRYSLRSTRLKKT